MKRRFIFFILTFAILTSYCIKNNPGQNLQITTLESSGTFSYENMRTISFNGGIKPTDDNAAVILGDVVNVRNQPSITGSVLFIVKENEFVRILHWESQTVKIGKFENRWVLIKNQRGQTGYMFGAFLFEFKNLFDNEWGCEVVGGYSVMVVLYKNGTYVLTGITSNFQNNTRSTLKRKGTYVISGRKIVFSGYIIGDKDLYMVGYKYLNDTKTKLDDNPDAGLYNGYFRSRNL